jgi:beta-glucosidase
VLGLGADAALFDVFDWGEGVLTLRSERTAKYVTVRDGGELVADADQPGGWDVHETFALLPQDDGTTVLRHWHSGRYARIDPLGGELVVTATGIEDAVRLRVKIVRAGLDDALAAVREAGVAVVVVGNDPHINGRETQDRTTLALPPAQDALIRAVARACPRTVLVVMSSYPYALGWADENLPAIVWTSHAGQETGPAVADVLLGEHSPTGRLPQTWYREDADLPDILEYDVIKHRRTYQYFEGRPLYPFGHGLTYSTFTYGPTEVSLGGGMVRVDVKLTNTGARTAVEVVQVYTRVVDGAPDRPVRRLQAFERVELQAGRTRTVHLEFPRSQVAHWDVVAQEHRVEPGSYDVLVGPSSGVIGSRAPLVVTGPAPGPRRVVDLDVAATDFDDYSRITLVDTTREAGDAVEAAGEDTWLLFRQADLDGATRLTVRVSRTGAGDAARLELRTGTPTGRLLAAAGVPTTGGRYAWAEVSTAVDGSGGVHDLYLRLPEGVRLDTFRLETAGFETAGPTR